MSLIHPEGYASRSKWARIARCGRSLPLRQNLQHLRTRRQLLTLLTADRPMSAFGQERT